MPSGKPARPFIHSQAGEGWRPVPEHYDDSSLSGASPDRPALQALLAEVRARKIDALSPHNSHLFITKRGSD
jgi:hypothetical protein